MPIKIFIYIYLLHFLMIIFAVDLIFTIKSRWLKISMDQIVSLDAWRQSKSYSKLLANGGWELSSKAVRSIPDPSYFYIVEPLRSRWASLAAYSRSEVAAMRENDLLSRQDARKYEGDDAAVRVISMLEGKIACTKKIFLTAINSALKFYANTETYEVGVGMGMHTCGILIYSNMVDDQLDFTVRPILFNPASEIASLDEVIQASVKYMDQDFENHPDYFSGVDYSAARDRLVRQGLTSELRF